jgi:primosomal protein N' (replication factor Y)
VVIPPPGQPLPVGGAGPTVSSLVEIAVPVPLRRTFVYRVPERLAESVAPGSVVKVPFGPRTMTGFVVGLDPPVPDVPVKEVLAVEDPEHPLPADVLDLCRWVAEYYLAPLGEVLRTALPAGLGKRTPGEVPGAGGTVSAISLSPEQDAALRAVTAAVRARDSTPFLLHGVTGSGKTEVYLRAAEAAVAAGGKALILIPEIALSPQMVGRVEARFGNRVALWHSALTPARRREVWVRTRRGEIDVLVGARSAVFAPIPDLRLIVIDEEHEGAYKQGDSPRYHGRDVALVRARLARAAVVLGSATPSLESRANAERGKYRLLRLPHRVERRPTALVRIVPIPRADERPRPVSLILGDALREALADTVSRGEQCILFLNRRGHSTVVQCDSCRHVLSCDQCDIALTWHLEGNRVVCHYCGRSRPTPVACPACPEGALAVFKGVGTQRVAKELERLYAGVRVLRLDTDSTRRRGSLEATLDAFQRGDADVLLGTQMVAKGLDIPNVTLVGVVNADLGLVLPDFRSAERTFQLLTQVAGRSGRGNRPGKVIFQSNHPDHVALAAAAGQDFETFYREEMKERTDPPYPPYVHLVNLLFDGKDRDAVEAEAEETAAALREKASDGAIDLMGPAPQPLSRLKGKHRWHLTLRGTDRRRLRELAAAALDRERPRRSAVRIAVDVDPSSLL